LKTAFAVAIGFFLGIAVASASVALFEWRLGRSLGNTLAGLAEMIPGAEEHGSERADAPHSERARP
jgi:hypothetical protein